MRNVCVAIVVLAFSFSSCGKPNRSIGFGAIQFEPTIGLNDPKAIWVLIKKQFPIPVTDSSVRAGRWSRHILLHAPYIFDSLLSGVYDVTFDFTNGPPVIDSSKIVYDTLDGKPIARDQIDYTGDLQSLPTSIHGVRVGADSVSFLTGIFIRPHYWITTMGDSPWEMEWDGTIRARLY